jgi:hypothetical protein
MGVLVGNTITKANNHFGPYSDNEAESTHHAGKVCQFHCWTPCTYIYEGYLESNLYLL